MPVYDPYDYRHGDSLVAGRRHQPFLAADGRHGRHRRPGPVSSAAARRSAPTRYSRPSTASTSSKPGDFHDILNGYNGFNAGPGYDLVTGLGTPNGSQLVPDLAYFGLSSRPALKSIAVTPGKPSVGVGLTRAAHRCGHLLRRHDARHDQFSDLGVGDAGGGDDRLPPAWPRRWPPARA